MARLYCHECGNSFRKEKYVTCPRCKCPLQQKQRKLFEDTTLDSRVVTWKGHRKILPFPRVEKDSLIVYLEDRIFTVYGLEGREEVVVGRSLSSDLWLAVETISKRHARLFRKQGKWYLEDLKSRNGTFLNGQPLEDGKEYEVGDGDVIEVSDFLFVCCFPKEETKKDDLFSSVTIGGIEKEALRLLEEDNTLLFLEKEEKMKEKFEEAAHVIQAYLKPVPSQIGKAKFRYLYHPLTKIGGDFYLVQDLGNGRVALALGDVSGHGLAASLLMIGCLTMLESKSKVLPSPSQVLFELNQEILPRLQPGTFITCFYCVLDTESGDLVFSSAGHHPPLICHKNGEVKSLPGKGLAIGLSQKPVYQDFCMTLSSGDRLLLFTDGVLEVEGGMKKKEKFVEKLSRHLANWRTVPWEEWLEELKNHVSSWEEQFGLEKLSEVLRESCGQELETCLTKILEALRAFAEGSPFQDDVTLIGVDWDVEQ